MELAVLKDLDVASLMHDATGRPLALAVDRIAPDPENIRTSIDPASLQELAESIRVGGLVHAIVVRIDPARRGHYLIVAGERRWRAVKLLGLPTIDAVVREIFDPYVQATENLQREGVAPLDLARWIAKREAEGTNRAEIARRLGKPASFITEAARLLDAAPPIMAALEAGRIPDTRSAYLLTNAYASDPASVEALLTESGPLTRAKVVASLAPPSNEMDAKRRHRSSKRAPASDLLGCGLAVAVGRRKGQLVLKRPRTPDIAEVLFEDGAREEVALASIRLVRWESV